VSTIHTREYDVRSDLQKTSPSVRARQSHNSQLPLCDTMRSRLRQAHQYRITYDESNDGPLPTSGFQPQLQMLAQLFPLGVADALIGIIKNDWGATSLSCLARHSGVPLYALMSGADAGTQWLRVLGVSTAAALRKMCAIVHLHADKLSHELSELHLSRVFST
jgi:hypothetical protein